MVSWYLHLHWYEVFPTAGPWWHYIDKVIKINHRLGHLTSVFAHWLNMIHDFQIFPFLGKQLQNPKMFFSISFDLVNVEAPSGYHYWPDRIVDKSLQLDWNNYCFSILQWTSPVQARNKGNGHLSKQQVVFVTVFEPPQYGRLFSLLT